MLVMIGELPKINLHLKRAPADALMASVATLARRKLERAKGIVYITDKPLPKLPKLAGAGLTVAAQHATADQVMAAIRAVMPVPVSVCGGDSCRSGCATCRWPRRCAR